MSFASKTSSLQAYHIVVFRKAIHPEFFGIEDRKQIKHGEYDFEAWIFQGGHTLLFQHQGLCLAEVVTDRVESLPERGLVTSLPCAGEKDHEETIADRIDYVTSVQTEILNDHLYLATYREMLEHGRGCDGLMVDWQEDDVEHPNLSLVDIQRYQDEVHLQSYHLRGDCSLVLRSQTICRAKKESPVEAE